MRLESTAHKSAAVSFREALMGGLAPDGGLYLPTELPRLGPDDLRAYRNLSFSGLAVELAQRLLAGEFEPSTIASLVSSALDFPVPAVKLGADRFVLELFHGPTLAFKDFGARFLARFFSHVLGERGGHATILVATSGDTGSAVAQGFVGVPLVKVVVLYPAGRVSAFQESQMAAVGGNVSALRIAGNFDDCQRLVKQAFLDPQLAGVHLSSANSINIGRLLPQVFYYVAAYLQVAAASPGDEIVFSVPTGNVGNLTAGVIARRMGVPIARLIAATNTNRVLPDYMESGTYTARASIATMSNAMDVGDPSNFARLLELHDGSLDEMRRALYSTAVTEEETRATIRSVYERFRYLLDPHAAVGWTAADRFAALSGDRRPIVTLATAHPAKFDAAIRATLGFAPALPDRYADWRDKPLLAVDLPAADYTALRDLLLETTG